MRNSFHPRGAAAGPPTPFKMQAMTDTTDHNLSLFHHAQALIPGGVNSPVRAFGSVGGVPRFMARGQGIPLPDTLALHAEELQGLCVWPQAPQTALHLSGGRQAEGPVRPAGPCGAVASGHCERAGTGAVDHRNRV